MPRYYICATCHETIQPLNELYCVMCCFIYKCSCYVKTIVRLKTLVYGTH